MTEFRENTTAYTGEPDSHSHYAAYAEVEPELTALYEQVVALKAGSIAENLERTARDREKITAETGMPEHQFWPYHLNHAVMETYKELIKPEIARLLDRHPDNTEFQSEQATNHACGYLVDLVYQDVQDLALERGYISVPIF